MLPCINRESLKLLVGTADERYQYSPEYFRNTHFPQVMHRYQFNQLVEELTEKELLNEILESDTTGNRLYLVFGSTGSGKSELLCWLKDQWLQMQINRPVIRISRSELNPQVLIKKCYETLGIEPQVRIDENQWDLLLNKPITIINQMVWSTLAEALPSDEQIVPIALLLRPVIEKNVLVFTRQIQKGELKNPLEILTIEQFNDLLANTTMDIEVDFASIRQSLIQKLDHFLFEGKDIKTLFKELSVLIQKLNIRPLLLIDDLVQSINVYATDLLDNLITLEEGNWDVVIGLTPGSFQDSTQGVKLTQRIQTLDTIDDRVKKLWISDESGKAFYNLDRNHVVTYMSKYLKELKSTQGFNCSLQCPHASDCSIIVPKSTGNPSKIEETMLNLLPFNEPMIQRVYDAIPVGKGKLRYMILNTKEIIKFMQGGRGRKIERVHPLIARNKFAEHSDILIKTLAEWYSSESESFITLSRPLLKHYHYNTNELTLELHELYENRPHVIKNEERLESPTEAVQSEHLIRDWIEGKIINEQLLEPVRLGIATVVHDVVKGTQFMKKFTSRTSSVIQRKEIVNRSKYPIRLSEVTDMNSSIFARRAYPLLEVSNIQQVKPAERAKKFHKIANHFEVAMWVYQADQLQDEWLSKLEEDLDVPLCVLAFQLKNWVNSWMQVHNSKWNAHIPSPFSIEVVNISEQLYQDWFLLRDNLVDPSQISVKFNFESWLLNYSPKKSLEQYSLGTETINMFFSRLKLEFEKYKGKLDQEFKVVLNELHEMKQFLQVQDINLYHQCLTLTNNFTNVDYNGIENYTSYRQLEEALYDSGLVADYVATQSARLEVVNLVTKFEEKINQLVKLSIDVTDGNVESFCQKGEVPWSGIEDQKKLWSKRTQYCSEIYDCLMQTPRFIVGEILKSDYSFTSFDDVKRLWQEIWEYVQSLMNSHEVDPVYKLTLKRWETIDFYQLQNDMHEWNQRSSEVKMLLVRLQDDMHTSSSDELEKVINRIKREDTIRPAVRRQLILLLEQGYSTLPPLQWRKLLVEFSERFPSVFAGVEIRMVVRGQGN
ncbi:hypothetical protein [Paenibacillus lautus]|uniref:Uncharacterized protein n=1 Tax=Paenibacillus lautus TaxID=1401 RepID=A0A385TRC1_PAELA|nr:hypothetical protein [Paenibacillus lautus]AYB46276.1 hypothetical protein D5F53_24575 [Paenibacillus lautus]